MEINLFLLLVLLVALMQVIRIPRQRALELFPATCRRYEPH